MLEVCGWPHQERALLRGKSALGADQDVDPRRPRRATLRANLKGLQGIGEFGGFIAEHQVAFRVALCEEALERNGIGDLCEAQYAALLRRLDDVGAHPLAV